MNTAKTESNRSSSVDTPNGYLILSILSVLMLTLMFFVSVSNLGLSAKVAAFLVTMVSHMGILFFVYRSFGNREKLEPEIETVGDEVFNKEVDEKLSALDEAGKFFSASLKPDDMLRLVASRIGELVSHKTCVLFLTTRENMLEASYASGENARAITQISLEPDEGIAGQAFLSGEVELDRDLTNDRKHIPKEILTGCDAALAIPLTRGTETFGVIVLYGGDGDQFSEKDKDLLEAVGERVAPLLVSSFSFEQNISNAMTDSLTSLPNERAFYLVLENRIAEAQRFQEQRPLTVLTIDIRGFADFNRSYGHSTGDSLLAFASEVIGGQLRKMDLLCRSMNDEFWVVLPTTNDETTNKIIKRLESAFSERKFELPDQKKYSVSLNLGAATFLRDGETTNQLLQKALLRKKQSKAEEESTVIMFPREYVN